MDHRGVKESLLKVAHWRSCQTLSYSADWSVLFGLCSVMNDAQSLREYEIPEEVLSKRDGKNLSIFEQQLIQ